jgi:hypothetical protein
VFWFLGGSSSSERGVAVVPQVSPSSAGAAVDVRF